MDKTHLRPLNRDAEQFRTNKSRWAEKGGKIKNGSGGGVGGWGRLRGGGVARLLEGGGGGGLARHAKDVKVNVKMLQSVRACVCVRACVRACVCVCVYV